MPTPEPQIESLKSAIRELDAKIESREGELVAAQVGMIGGEIAMLLGRFLPGWP